MPTALQDDHERRYQIMLQRIGFFTMCIGAMLADSNCVLIPLGVAAIGAILVWIGLGKEPDRETA